MLRTGVTFALKQALQSSRTASAAAFGTAAYGATGPLRTNAKSVAQKLAALQGARPFASAAHKASNPFRPIIIIGGVVGGVFAYTLFHSGMPQSPGLIVASSLGSKPGDYAAVKKAISDVLDNDNYDDGSMGPLLVRLAWHTSGTYDAKAGTGGSNGATMRFAPEIDWGANKGLRIAQKLLEPIKAKFPWISYGDLWTLAGAHAIEEMGGPHIPWRPGRQDKLDGSNGPPDGTLPDAAQGGAHIRAIFGRMGFTDQEAVALIGAHALGRCHTDRSGYDGPWTNAPTTFSNQYFIKLFDDTWVKKKWDGPLQYEDKATGKLMMTPADLALKQDRGLKRYAQEYYKDEEKFFKDFAAAFSKLLELGVPFPADAKYI